MLLRLGSSFSLPYATEHDEIVFICAPSFWQAPKSEVLNTEAGRMRLKVKKPDEPVLAKILDLTFCAEYQDLVDEVLAYRLERGIKSSDSLTGMMTRARTAAVAAAKAVAEGDGDPNRIDPAPLNSKVCVMLKNDKLITGVVRWKGEVPGYGGSCWPGDGKRMQQLAL